MLTFGLISGAVAVGLLLATLPFINTHDLGKADTLGYTSMVLSALIVYFGVRSSRDHPGASQITFGRAFAVGCLITLVSCACYMLAFQIIYFGAMPGFGEKFAECMVERARASGAAPHEIAETARQAQTLKQMYDRPATNAALTFATTFPIGLIASVISAAILRKKQGRK
ncbi:MAG: DUF4199 domain-containing protein [Candidatus Acidiferrales bacterium]